MGSSLLALVVLASASSGDEPRVAALVKAQEKVGYSDYLALVRENVRAERTLKALMDADQLRTSHDFLTASGLIQNAPGYEPYLLAHEWAVSALMLGDPGAPARVKLTWDRLQLASGRPQRFGSVTRRNAEGKSVPRPTDPTPADLGPATGENDAELRTIRDADQADRSGNIDFNVVGPRDAARRARVLAILGESRVRTGEDAYNAALVLQHGDGYGDFMLAHELCLSAIARSYRDAAWLVSRTYDRMLQNGGHAQRYGTQSMMNQGGSTAYVLDADVPGPSDTMRLLLASPKRAETRAALDAWRKTIKP